MVPLLVLATFAVFIAVEAALHWRRRRVQAPEEIPEPAANSETAVAGGVGLPETLRYHPGHSWAAHLGHGRIRVGLDEFAASLLGRIERIELPLRGRWLRQGDKGWIVHTPQGKALMPAPVEGEIVAVNDRLTEDPSLAARDPYGAGWLLEVFSPDAEVSLRNLLSGSLARRWMELAVAELRRALSPSAMVTALDGGRLRVELGADLPPEKWRELTRRFFLC